MLPTAADFLQRLDRTHNGVRGLLPAWRNLSKEDRRVTACAFLTSAILQMDVEALNVSSVIAENMLQPLPSDLVVRYLEAVVHRRAQQEPQYRRDYDELEAEHRTSQRVAEVMEKDAAAWSPAVFERLVATGLYGLLDTDLTTAAFATWWQSLDGAARKAQASVALQALNTPEFATAPYAVREKTFTSINEQMLAQMPPADRLEVMRAFVEAKMVAVGGSTGAVAEVQALNQLTCLPACAALVVDYPARYSWLEPLANPQYSAEMARSLTDGVLAFSGDAARTGAQWGHRVGEIMNTVAQDPDSYTVILYATILQHAFEKGMIAAQQFNECVKSFIGEDMGNLETYLPSLNAVGVVLEFKVHCQEVLLAQSFDAPVATAPKPRF